MIFLSIHSNCATRGFSAQNEKLILCQSIHNNDARLNDEMLYVGNIAIDKAKAWKEILDLSQNTGKWNVDSVAKFKEMVSHWKEGRKERNLRKMEVEKERFELTAIVSDSGSMTS